MNSRRSGSPQATPDSGRRPGTEFSCTSFVKRSTRCRTELATLRAVAAGQALGSTQVELPGERRTLVTGQKHPDAHCRGHSFLPRSRVSHEGSQS